MDNQCELVGHNRCMKVQYEQLGKYFMNKKRRQRWEHKIWILSVPIA